MIRFTKPEDLELINKWRKDHNLFLMDKLPNLGFMYNEILALFVINTDVDFCVLEYLISDPKSSKEDRDKGLKQLLNDDIPKVIKTLGYTKVFAFLENKSSINHLKKNGFFEISKNTHSFIKYVGV